MKASLVGGMLFGLLLQLAPAHAEGAQVEQGFVVAPMWDESCTRFVDANLDWAARSHIGFVFTVEAATWGSRFSVTPDHELADLDISFRRERRFPWHRYETRALGGERGRVPQGVHEALVCLYIGAPTTFTYRAGPGI